MLSKGERQAQLVAELSAHPFLSDEELAGMFAVSVQTIRLDRLALSIPELRKRTKTVAERLHTVVRSLGSREILGELVDLQLGANGVTVLETTETMVFAKSGVVQGRFIFAQAESLALAIIDASVALTGLANIKFKRPVHVGERLVAKAEAIRRKGNKTVVQVVTTSGPEQVFRGKFVVAGITDWEAN